MSDPPSADWLKPNRKVLADVMLAFFVGAGVGFVIGQSDGDAERASLRQQLRAANGKAAVVRRTVCTYANPKTECEWAGSASLPCQCPGMSGSGTIVER